MKILAREKGLLHGRIPRDVRQQTQLNLAVVRVHQHRALRCGKHGADLRPQLAPDRNVLQVGLR